MHKRFFVIAILASLLYRVMSQAPDLAAVAREAARGQLPADAKLVSLSQQLAESTALGCGLIPGLPLPDPLMVFRLAFLLDVQEYVVYVSSDGGLAQVCDERFASLGSGVQPILREHTDSDGDGLRDSADACPLVAGIHSAGRPGCPVLSTVDSDGDGTADARDRCPAQAGAAVADGCSLMRDGDGDGAPDRIDICREQAGIMQPDFALGCPRDGSGKSTYVRKAADLCHIVGVDMPVYASPAAGASISARVHSATVLGISAAGDWHHAQRGWLKANSGSLLGACFNIPLVHPSANFSGCYMRPGGKYVNIRQAPQGKLAGRLQEHEQVAATGMNAAGSWLFFRKGWASRSVLELAGDCGSLPILNPARAASGVLRFCPPEFEGYLPPRIETGLARARVVSHDYANRLRAAPDYAAELIGEIPAASIIDAVLDGPACQAPYVWWQVRSGGQVGWTVESDIKAYHYYLAPVAPAAAEGDRTGLALAAADANQLIHSANMASLGIAASLSVPAPLDLAWISRGAQLAALSENGEIRLFDAPDFAQARPVLQFSGSSKAMAASPDGRWLAIGGDDGSITLMDLADASTRRLGALPGSVRGLAWSRSGDYLAAISGDEALRLTRRAGALKLWRMDGAGSGLWNLLAHNHFPYPLAGLAFSSDGRWLAVTGESRRSGRAALWVYAAEDGELAISKALIPSSGQAMVMATPAADLGDFVYSSGDSLWSLDMKSGADQRFYHQAGAIVTGAAFRRQALPGAEALLALAVLSAGGERQLRIVNALNPHAPRAMYALAADDLAFSPDGRVLGVVAASGDRVLLLAASGE